MIKLLEMVDHTILKADATKDMIINLCKEARDYNFAAVCVNPCHVKLCKEILADSQVKIATVVGFPLGANSMETKKFETRQAIEDGADEIDMVINIGALKDKDYDLVKEDIKSVLDAARDRALVKLIIETCLLSDEEKIKACQLAKELGVDFVKTSTGFSTGGATLADVKLMKSILGDSIGVKASGGVRDLETARKMVEAGASRLGTSSGLKIAEEMKNEK